MKFMIQKEGWPPHYLESDEDVMVLSRTDITKILMAQRKACADNIRAEDDDGQMMSMREDYATAMGRRLALETPLAEDVVDTLTYDG